MYKIFDLLFLRFLRTFSIFLPRDKSFLVRNGLRFVKDLPCCTVIKTQDGRKFNIPTIHGIYRALFFYNCHETIETDILMKIVHKGDVVIDIGANFGWYTTLFGRLVGFRGQVHSFEPAQPLFKELEINVGLNKLSNAYLNKIALGDKKRKSIIYFSKSCHNASMFLKYGGDSSARECIAETLDRYIHDKKLKRVDFVKCDVDGAEMSVLKGAKELFSLRNAPMLMIESDPRALEAAGYKFRDILSYLRDLNDYEFYRFIQIGRESKVTKLEEGNINIFSGNILCIIPHLHFNRIKKLVI